MAEQSNVRPLHQPGTEPPATVERNAYAATGRAGRLVLQVGSAGKVTGYAREVLDAVVALTAMFSKFRDLVKNGHLLKQAASLGALEGNTGPDHLRRGLARLAADGYIHHNQSRPRAKRCVGAPWWAIEGMSQLARCPVCGTVDRLQPVPMAARLVIANTRDLECSDLANTRDLECSTREISRTQHARSRVPTEKVIREVTEQARLPLLATVDGPASDIVTAVEQLHTVMRSTHRRAGSWPGEPSDSEVDATGRALRAGWTAEAMIDRLAGQHLDDVRNVRAVLAHRILQIIEQPPPQPTSTPAPTTAVDDPSDQLMAWLADTGDLDTVISLAEGLDGPDSLDERIRTVCAQLFPEKVPPAEAVRDQIRHTLRRSTGGV